MRSAKRIFPALNDFDIKLTGLLNMKIKLIALAIMASVTSGMVHAQLSTEDQQIVARYLSSNPEIPQDKVTAIRGMTTLDDVSRFVTGNSYYNANTNILIFLPALDTSTPVDHPIADVLRSPVTQPTAQETLQQRFAALKGEALVKANQERTAEQTQALKEAYHQRFEQLKGESLVTANQERTAEQQQALQDAYRTRFAQLKGDALTQANQARTVGEVAALQAAESQSLTEANQARTAGQKTALLVAQAQPKAGATSIGYAPSNDGSNIVIGIKGQDEGDKVYDLDAMENTGTTNANNIVQNTHDISVNKDSIDQSKTAIAANASNIDQNSHDISDSKNVINQNTHDISVYKDSIDQTKSAIAANTANIDQNSHDISDSKNVINHNTAAIAKNKSGVADNHAAIADHEQRIEKLESSNSANFGKLKSEVDDNRQRASAAISGVAAMANIPQVIQGQTFSVGAGVGTTDGESALAVGFSARAAEHVVVKASVSDDTQQNFVVGGGVSYGW